MTDKEIKLYEHLMCAILAKEHENVDEHDVQRVLGALYQY